MVLKKLVLCQLGKWKAPVFLLILRIQNGKLYPKWLSDLEQRMKEELTIGVHCNTHLKLKCLDSTGQEEVYIGLIILAMMKKLWVPLKGLF